MSRKLDEDDQLAAPPPKFCIDRGHKYEAINASTERRTAEDGGVEVYNSFICAQCGEVIQRRIAKWPPRTKSADDKAF